MRKLIVTANFHVDIDQGEGKPAVRKLYSKGLVVEETDIPDGHTADGWIEKGLATEAGQQA